MSITAANRPATNTNAWMDECDLGIASSELAAGREMLLEAHALPERGGRDEAIKTAVAKLELATRAIGTVVDRRKK